MRAAALSTWLAVVLVLVIVALGNFYTQGATPQPPIEDPATLTEFIVNGVVIVTGTLLVLHVSLARSIRATFFLLAVLVVLFLSGYQYFKNASSKTFHYGPLASAKPIPGRTPTAVTFDCFGKPIRRSDAIYIALGVLTTAGTGSLNPRTRECRKIVSTQMVLDLGLIGFGVAALYAGRNGKHPPEMFELEVPEPEDEDEDEGSE